MTIEDPWATAPAPPAPPGPPPGPGPSPSGGKKNVIIGASIAGVVVIAAAVGIPLALSGNHPHHPNSITTTVPPAPTTAATAPNTTAPDTTVPTSTSNQGAPKLPNAIPSAFQSDCALSTSPLDLNASQQAICQGGSVPDVGASGGIIYLTYRSSNDSEQYYSSTLLGGNGMQNSFNSDGTGPSVGTCTTLQLDGSTSSGSYCEEDVTTSGQLTGHEFLFVGSSFSVGSGVDLGQVLSCPNQGFIVDAWTDDPTDLTAMAVSCSTNSSTAHAIESDYLQGNFDLSSS